MCNLREQKKYSLNNIVFFSIQKKLAAICHYWHENSFSLIDLHTRIHIYNKYIGLYLLGGTLLECYHFMQLDT